MEKVKLKQLRERFELLDMEELIENLYGYIPTYQLLLSKYFPEGYAGWPTWLVVVYRGKIIEGYDLIMICGDSSLSKRWTSEDYEAIKSFIQYVDPKNLFFLLDPRTSNFLANERLFTVPQGGEIHQFLINNGVQVDI